MQDWITANFGNLLTSLTILTGIVTWYISKNSSAQSNLVAHTASMLSATTTEEHLAKADFIINRILNQSGKFESDSMDEETESALFLMLNYYEYLCALEQLNVIDKKTLLHLRGGLMKQTFDAARAYIDSYRRMQNRPEIYANLEALANQVQ